MSISGIVFRDAESVRRQTLEASSDGVRGGLIGIICHLNSLVIFFENYLFGVVVRDDRTEMSPRRSGTVATIVHDRQERKRY